MSEKHGKICDNMKTEPKIFHALNNLVSDKLGKTIKITSLQVQVNCCELIRFTHINWNKNSTILYNAHCVN